MVVPAGLELATRLGDTLGRRGKAEITLIERKHSHVWKPKLHEIAAGSMDFGDHEVGYLGPCPPAWLPLPHRRDDRHRPPQREVHVAPYADREGRRSHPGALLPLRHLVIAVGSQSNDFGTPGYASTR